MTDCVEVPLTGGRITQGVVRIGGFVHRPLCANSGFVHSVLQWLEHKAVDCCPRFLGIDERGREITTFLPGWSPADLGYFTDAQCLRAVSIIKTLHEALVDFPACAPGQTVCHNDLSPCNFMFRDDEPYAVFDWDATAVGEPLDDLAYAVWMWLDIGNDEIEIEYTAARMRLMLDCYGVNKEERIVFCGRIFRQMERVGKSQFPTAEQTAAVNQWVVQCMNQLRVITKCWHGSSRSCR